MATLADLRRYVGQEVTVDKVTGVLYEPPQFKNCFYVIAGEGCVNLLIKPGEARTVELPDGKSIDLSKIQV